MKKPIQNSIEKIFSLLENSELIQMANELNKISIPEDAFCRKVSKEIYGEVNLVQLIGLGVSLSIELAKRLNDAEDKIISLYEDLAGEDTNRIYWKK